LLLVLEPQPGESLSEVTGAMDDGEDEDGPVRDSIRNNIGTYDESTNDHPIGQRQFAAPVSKPGQGLTTAIDGPKNPLLIIEPVGGERSGYLEQIVLSAPCQAHFHSAASRC
jgi:hypothetical protein